MAQSLRDAGKTWVEIADQLRQRWPELNPRAAMRIAHGWTQAEAAEEWNKIWPDPVRTFTDISDLERRRPGFAKLDKLARLYECAVPDLLGDLGDYRHRDDANVRAEGSAEHPVVQTPIDDGVSSGEQSGKAADGPMSPDLGGIEAIELLRRVEVTDTGPATLAAIADGVDGFSRSYTDSAPAELLVHLRQYQGYVARLLDGRATLAQRLELMRQAGWLSLLTATADMDVGYDHAATTNLEVARHLADETGDLSLAGWTLETQAWQALSNGDYSRAADLCRAGLDVAPDDTSAYVQLCTQLARVAARLGDASTTHRMVDESVRAVDRAWQPGQPEHHFVCDRGRVVALCAAALVWLGEGGNLAEEYARRAVAQYEGGDGRWTHRLAAARLNLALLLARNNEPSEATHLGNLAFESSWRLCHTDLFLVADLDHALIGRYPDDTEVTSFHDHYLDVRHRIDSLRDDAASPIDVTD